MTERKTSIRIAVSGGADVLRAQKEIGDGGEVMGRRVASGVDAAAASLGKLETSAKRLPSAYREVGTSGADAGKRAAAGFDAAAAAADKLAVAQARASRTQKDWAKSQGKNDWASGEPGGKPASFDAVHAYLQQQRSMAAAQAQYFGNVSAETGKRASASWAAFSAASEADRARIEQVQQWRREQTGGNFRTSYERSMGIGADGKSARDSAGVFEEQDRQLSSLKARAQALLAEIDPLAIAQGKLTEETAEYDRMLAAGLLTEKQHADALSASRVRYEKVSDAAARAAGGMRLNSFQMTNLVYQMNDVVSGLAMGQRPLSVLMQQGGQIYQVFQGSGMGVTGAIKAVGAALSGLLSPTALVTGGITTVAASLAYLEYQGVKTGKGIDAALSGTGRIAGLTPSQLNDMAVQAARQSDESVGKTRGWTEQFVKSGRMPGPGAGKLAALVPNYAATTGQDEASAAKELLSAFSDLGKGVETLDAKTGAYDASTRRTIQTLTAEGQYAEADRIAIEKLSQALVDYHTQMNWFERQGHSVATWFGDAADAMAQKVSGGTNADQIRELERQRQRSVAQTKLKDLFLAGEARVEIKNIDAELAALHQRENQRIKDAQQKTADAWAKIKADLAEPILVKTVQSVRESEFRRDLGAQHYNLRKLLTDPAALKKSGRTKEEVEQGLAGTEYADQSRQTDAEKFTAGQAQSVRSAMAVTPRQKAQAAADEFRLSQRGNENTNQAQVDRQAAEVYGATLARESFQLTRTNALLVRNVALTGDVAAAYLKSGSAAMRATALRQAALESMQTGVDAEMRMRTILGQTVANQNETTAQAVARLAAETMARKAVDDQLVRGTLACSDYGRAIQTTLALTDELTAKDAALGEAEKARREGRPKDAAQFLAQAAAADRNIAAYRKAAAENDAGARAGTGLKALDDQRWQAGLLRDRLADAYAGGRPSSDDMADRKVLEDRNALLEKGFAIERDGALILTETGRRYVENNRLIDEMNRNLERTKSASATVYAAESGVFDRLGDELSSRRADWDSYFEYVRSSFAKTSLELTLVNPLKNALLGGDGNGNLLPTAGDASGIVGHILGNDDRVEDAVVTGRKGTTASITPSYLKGGAGGLGGVFKSLFSESGRIDDVQVTGRYGEIAPSSWWSDTWLANLFHNGGDVTPSANSGRRLTRDALAFAPRFHGGADLSLKPDEIPAILQTGEKVLNRAQAADYGKGKSATAATAFAPTINVNNHGTPSVASGVSYDPGSDTLNIDLEDQLATSMRSGVRNGAYDTAFSDRYGVQPLTTRR